MPSTNQKNTKNGSRRGRSDKQEARIEAGKRRAQEIRDRGGELALLILERYGDGSHKLSGGHLLGNCPWRPDSDSKSFSLKPETGGWSYFAGTGRERSGDALHLLSHVLGHGGDTGRCFPELVRVAGEMLGLPPLGDGPPPIFWAEPDSQEALEKDTGLAWADFEAAGCERQPYEFDLDGETGRPCLRYPYETPKGDAFKFKTRARRNGKRESRAQPTGMGAGLFWAKRPAEGEALVLAGGEEKAIAAAKAGFAACCPYDGESGPFGEWQLGRIVETKPSKVIIAFDNDDPGRKGSLAKGRLLAEAGVCVAVVEWPARFKHKGDLNDTLKAKGQDGLRALLEQAPLLDFSKPDRVLELERIARLEPEARETALGSVFEEQAKHGDVALDALEAEVKEVFKGSIKAKSIEGIRRRAQTDAASEERDALAAMDATEDEAKKTHQEGAKTTDEPPSIMLSGRQLVDPCGGPSPAKEAWEALLKGKRGKDIFTRDGELVVLRERFGSLRPVPMTEALLAGRLMSSARWLRSRSREGARSASEPPKTLLKIMLAEPDPSVRPLRDVVSMPFFTEDGRLVAKQGYDSKTATWLELGDLKDMPRVSASPNREDVLEARRLLLGDLTGQFPFDSKASRANWLALAVAPFMREMTGLAPLGLVDAASAGSGKSYLAGLIAVLVSGKPPQPESINPTNDDETRKLLTSIFGEGRRVIFFDNASPRHYLDLPTLAKTLTSETPSDRRLGANETVSMRNKACWLLTGNNTRCSNEMARRSILVRLDAQCERPDKRQGFHIEDILQHALDKRAKYVWAALTLAANWIANGQPSGQGKMAAPFAKWSRIMSGVLEVAGVDSFDKNRDMLEQNVDAETAEAREFIAEWVSWIVPGETQSAGQLAQLADDRDMLSGVLGDKKERGRATSMGQWLKNHLGKVFEIEGRSWKIERAKGKTTQWLVVRQESKSKESLPAFDPNADGTLQIPRIAADLADLRTSKRTSKPEGPAQQNTVEKRVSEDSADLADLNQEKSREKKSVSEEETMRPCKATSRGRTFPEGPKNGKKVRKVRKAVTEPLPEKGLNRADLGADRSATFAKRSARSGSEARKSEGSTKPAGPGESPDIPFENLPPSKPRPFDLAPTRGEGVADREGGQPLDCAGGLNFEGLSAPRTWDDLKTLPESLANRIVDLLDPMKAEPSGEDFAEAFGKAVAQLKAENREVIV